MSGYRATRSNNESDKQNSVFDQVQAGCSIHPSWGSRDGAAVRALASHQCGPGSIPGPGVICGLSLLLVLVLAPRGFSPGAPVFLSPQKTRFLNSNSIWKVSLISALC